MKQHSSKKLNISLKEVAHGYPIQKIENHETEMKKNKPCQIYRCGERQSIQKGALSDPKAWLS